MDIVIGMTTAPRSTPYIQETLESLAATGQDAPVYLFAEPDSVIPSHPLLRQTIQNRDRLGCFYNWFAAASWMIGHTTAPYILLMQDDVIFRPDAFQELERNATLYQRQNVGFLSMYTNLAMLPLNPDGGEDSWGVANFNKTRGYWGALACCWPREKLRAALQTTALQHPEQAHAPATPAVRLRKVDVLIGRACLELQLRIYTPRASLADHIGEESTIGRDKIPGIAAGRRGVKFHT